MDVMVIPNRVRVVAVMWALALAGGLLTLALLAKPTQAQTKGAVSEQFPVEFTIDASACAGELIEITGTLHTVNHFRDLGDGTYHVNSHFNLAGVKGIGQTTGEEYVIPASGSGVENVVAEGQIVTGTVDVNLVVGKGEIPNQVAFGRIHYVISGDGTVKVETLNFHFKCQPDNTSATTTADTATTASPTATASPATGGAPLAMGAGVLLVGAGLLARRIY